MNSKEIENVIKLSPEKRYAYFIKKVADMEELWSLDDDGLVSSSDEEEIDSIPFWSHAEYAEICATDEWATAKPKRISLDEFFLTWVPMMKKNGIRASIFRAPNGESVAPNLERLVKDLQEELELYE